MKLQIFIETGEGEILVDRTFAIVDGIAPKIELQEIIDDASKYLHEQEVTDEVNSMIRDDKAQS